VNFFSTTRGQGYLALLRIRAANINQRIYFAESETRRAHKERA
jgi:hypothetical protein